MPTPPKRGKCQCKRPKAVIKSETAAALDRTKTSHRNAVFILSAFAKDNDLDLENLALNPTSIYRTVYHKRKTESTKSHDNFSHKGPLTVHWDGKMLPTLTGKEKEDRLPVLVTGVEIEKILSVPAIESGSGKDQADSVYGCITDWNLTGKIKALSFDTTSSNTGKDKGATVILQKLLK